MSMYGCIVKFDTLGYLRSRVDDLKLPKQVTIQRNTYT